MFNFHLTSMKNKGTLHEDCGNISQTASYNEKRFRYILYNKSKNNFYNNNNNNIY